MQTTLLYIYIFPFQKPLEDTTYIEGNLKRMKDKLEQVH